MYNRRYHKAFVMLNQDTNGFNVGNKSAWGNVSIEIRNAVGTITATVSQLKPLMGGREYVLYVIAGDKGEAMGIRCGNIAIDTAGRGELKWQFNPDNVGETTKTAEDLHTIAILVEGGQSCGLTSPLVGFVGKDINWKKNFRPYNKNLRSIANDIKPETPIKKNVPKIEKTEIKKDEPKIEKPEPEIKKDEPKIEKPETEIKKDDPKIVKPEIEIKRDEPNIILEEIIDIPNEPSLKQDAELKPENKSQADEATLEIRRTDDFHKTFKDMMVRFQNELDTLEEAQVITPNDKARINAAGGIRFNPDNEAVMQLNYIKTQNTPMDPFCDDKRQWRCISMEELAVLPVEFLSMMRQSFFILPYRRYKHFLFGWDENDTCYLGVPDNYVAENKNIAESLGFYSFLPCKGSNVKPGKIGYWLKEIIATKK